MEKKQYRHRQSGKVATTWGYTIGDEKVYYQIENEHHLVPFYVIEDTQDWELVQEPHTEKKEWMITQFRQGGVGMWYVAPDGKYNTENYKDDKRGIFLLESMLKGGGATVKNGELTIHQVRRESDGAVFTVGDKYASTIGEFGVRTIEKFEISAGGRMMVWAVEDGYKNGAPTSALDHIQHVPAPVPESTWVIDSVQLEGSDSIRKVKKGVVMMAGNENKPLVHSTRADNKRTTNNALELVTGKGGTEIWTIHSARATPDSEVIALGDWVVAECTHMCNTPMQVEGFVVNDRNNLLVKTRQFRTHGVGICNCRKVDAPVEKKKQEPVAKVDEYVIAKDDSVLPDRACIVTALPDGDDEKYYYTYPDGKTNSCSARWIRKATPEEIQRDWGKKEPVQEKPQPLMQVLLTQKEIDKLRKILQSDCL